MSVGEGAFNTLKSRTALRYPFSVVHDPNPKGAAWLVASRSESSNDAR